MIRFIRFAFLVALFVASSFETVFAQAVSLRAVIQANRTTCTAPCAIFFEGTESTDASGNKIGHGPTTGGQGLLGNDIVEYTWDFGEGSEDDSGGRYFSGFNAAHVYETSGTKTVRLRTTDGQGRSDEGTVEITVSDFSGAVICRANDNSDWSGCLPGATQQVTSSYTGAAANTKVLYRRGDTFGYSGNITSGSNSIVGAFGDCTAAGGTFDERGICSKNPLIKWVSGPGGSAMDASYDNNLVFSDLEVDACDPHNNYLWRRLLSALGVT